MDVATHKPDDVLLVLIAIGEEGTILLSILHTQFAIFHQSTPDTHHSDVDAVLSSHINDIVHVVPIAINAFLVNLFEVPTIDIRHLTIDVISRNAIDGLHLNNVIACLRTALQIPFRLSPVESFWQQPTRFAQPEERLSVLKLQITLVIRYL